MNAKWAVKLWAAQRRETLFIDGRNHRRIRYGSERWGYPCPNIPCHDCGARKGQFHGPGCDMERCPACRGQLLSCGCLVPVESFG
jgi:hypothetical protein